MHLNEIEQYKYKIRLYFNAIGGIAVFIFSILQITREDYLTGLISLIGVTYFVLVICTLKKRQHYLWQGRGFALIVPITIFNTLNLHPEYGIYWVYVGIISFFLLLEFKDACISVVLFDAGVFYLTYLHFDLSAELRIYASILIVTVFSALISLLINRLLRTLSRLINHDSLTDALNRHTFHCSINETIYAYKRFQTPSSLFIFDLDFFKKVNDLYGHLKGDEVLVTVAKTIQNRLRDSDKLFRYGGEEFAVLLAHTNEEDAFKLAEELRSLVEQQNYNIEQPVTISGGVSSVRESDNAQDWIARCDKALYKAKSSGRNRVVTAKV